MTNEDITRKFLLLLAGYWDDPTVHCGFKTLREQVSGQGEWAGIIEARLLALGNKADEAVTLLEEILDRDSIDFAAVLMLARILNIEVCKFQKALDVLDHIWSRGFEGQILPEWFEAMVMNEKIYALSKDSMWDEALDTADRLQDRFGEAQEPFLAAQVARALINKSVIIEHQGEFDEAIRVYDNLEHRFGEDMSPSIQMQVATALANKGVVLWEQEKPEEAIRVYEEVARRFGEARVPGIQAQVARVLANKGVALGQQGKIEEEILAYEEVERRFGEATTSGIQTEVARALANKGVALGQQQGKLEEEILAYEEVERRFGEARAPGIQAQVARALANKGVALGQQGKLEEAIRAYEEVERRFGEATTSGIQTEVARALSNKGVALEQQGKLEEAIRAYEEVERRFGEATAPGVQEQAARALSNKGVVLWQQDKPEEAILVYEEVERRFGEATAPGVQEQAARALSNKGVVLVQQGKYEEAIRIYEDIELRFGEAKTPGMQEHVACALANKGVALNQQGKHEEAIRIYEDVECRFGKIMVPGVQSQVARALVDKGFALGQLGKQEEAIRVYEKVERSFGKTLAPGIQEQLASALANKGVALGQQGKPDEEIRVYEEVERRFGKAKSPGMQEPVARALVNKGVALGQKGKPDEEIRVYEEVERRFGEATAPVVQTEVARALVYKGWTLGDAEKWPDADHAYDEVVRLFGESRAQPLRKWVLEALLRKSLVLLKTHQKMEARRLFESIQQTLISDHLTKKELSELYTFVSRILLSEIPQEDARERQESKRRDLEITEDDHESHLGIILSHVLDEINPEMQYEYFCKIEKAESRSDRFITSNAHFSDKFSFLLVLREWNSYTPVIPSGEESDRGGGYYIRHEKQGIVIDPGYDFIENFHRAGGMLSGIDHIIVTHAHDDHTAELEALLMLFQRRWNKGNVPKKCVNLYLSAGVQRKFSGLLDLRDPKYGKVVTLCPSTNQRIALNEKTLLTVLPAFHDDVLTRDSAVGLGFEFDTENGKRRIVFTGDSGFHPRKLGPDGGAMYYDPEKNQHPMLDTTPGKALFGQYPEEFRNAPHLVIAHIGSIKKQEFGKASKVPPPNERGSLFYPNHLGLLGTLMLLNALHPDAAVISEFGAELKGFHIELVQKLGMALNKIQSERVPGKKKTFVVAGDLTTAYDITNHRFLSHTQLENGAFEFVDIEKLTCRKADDYLHRPEWVEEVDVSKKEDSERAYIFIDGDKRHVDNYNAKHYAKHFFGRKLPYQTGPVATEEELYE